MEVDLLAGEYEGTAPKHRTQPVHEGRARKARGCDLAFDLYIETEIEGALPEGGKDRARIRVSSAVAFLVMKGMALHDRLKEVDVQPRRRVQLRQRFRGFGAAQATVADQPSNDGAVLLFHPGIVVLLVRS